MTHAERLVDCTHNPLARELLRTAEMDRAPENTAAKVALALGLGTSVVITTAATSAAAGSGVAGGAGSTVAAGAMAAPAAAAVAAAPAVAAVPAATGAVTAAGLVKVMAAVSLACGTLSYGSVKLAMKAAEKPAVMTPAPHAAPVTRHRAVRPVARSVAALPRLGESDVTREANLPVPPPPPPDNGNTDDPVGAARVEEASAVTTSQVAADPRQMALNVTAQVTHATAAARRTPAAAAREPSVVTIPHTAAFPNDDAQPVAGHAPPKPAASTNDLEREVARLDNARAALASGRPAQAVRELDQYRVEAPRGALAAESVVLRVKALLALGQRAAAEIEARPLLMSAPQSRHAERLRELFGASTKTP